MAALASIHVRLYSDNDLRQPRSNISSSWNHSYHFIMTILPFFFPSISDRVLCMPDFIAVTIFLMQLSVLIGSGRQTRRLNPMHRLELPDPKLFHLALGGSNPHPQQHLWCLNQWPPLPSFVLVARPVFAHSAGQRRCLRTRHKHQLGVVLWSGLLEIPVRSDTTCSVSSLTTPSGHWILVLYQDVDERKSFFICSWIHFLNNKLSFTLNISVIQS